MWDIAFRPLFISRYPATRIALQRGVRFVLSIEPDKQSFIELMRLAPWHNKSSGSRYLPVYGAAGNARGKKKMAFDRTQSSGSCFSCQDLRSVRTVEKTVSVYTVDDLLEGRDNRDVEDRRQWKRETEKAKIALVKADTQGYEANAIQGLRRTLDKGMVESVIIEYDPHLLRYRNNANEALRLLFSAGLECAPLKVMGLGSKAGKQHYFKSSVHAGSSDNFWNFMRQRAPGYTELFCSRR